MNSKILKLIVFISKKVLHLFLLQLVSLQLLMANHAEGQKLDEIVLSFDVQNATLPEVFAAIEKKTGFTFGYDRKLSREKTQVSYQFKQKSLLAILERVSEDHRLHFKRINNNISVKKVREKHIVNQLSDSKVIDKEISGKVTDSQTGEPLIGATVQVKGTSVGTITNAEGKFTFSIPDDAVALVISYVGFMATEVNINNQSYFDVSLDADVNALNEVVVIGYGELERENLSSSIVKVGGDKIKEVPTSGLDHALQGRAAGVVVTQNSSAPGGGVSIRIRGGNSILGGNEPLYVIDGFPIYNDNALYTPGNVGQAPNALASINPNNIESIEVLKDASATAIYGARGANGVVLITTKRGRLNAQEVSLESYYGVQEVANRLDVLNARDFVAISNEAHANDGLAPIFGSPESFGEGTDWQDEIFRTAPIQSHQLTFSGGNSATRYAIMGNYFSQDGVIKGSGFKRGTVRLNLDSRISEKFEVGTSLTASRTQNDQNIADTGEGGLFGGVMNYALTIAPTISVRDEEGNFNWNDLPSSPPVGNPVALATEPTNQIITNRVLGNVYAKYYITDDLSVKVSLGGDFSDATRDLFLPSTLRRASTDNGQASILTNRVTSWLNENIISYNKIFSDDHRVNVIAGFTSQGQDIRNVAARAFGFSSDLIRTDNLGAGSDPQIPSSSRREWQMMSALTRVNYGYKNRYLLSLTMRADGSSKFGEGNRWGYFPAVSAAWRLINEDFMLSQSLFSDLKLRASYGVSGNQEIGEYQSLAALGVQNYIIGDELVNGVGPVRVANPDLKWETTSQLDIGVDFSLFEDRLSVSADYYTKRTDDLLLFVTLPSVTGFTRALQNSGSMENRGFELAVDSKIIDGAFKWTLGGNISFNRNEVIDLGPSGEFSSGAVVGSIGLNFSGVVREGEPIGNFNGYVFDGIFQNQQEIDAHGAQPTAQPGDIRYRDTNGDGAINTSDLQIIGDAQPDYNFGINSNMSYKNFSLNLLLTGVGGAEVLNMNRFEMESVSGLTSQLSDVLGRWTPTNPSNTIPSATTSPDFRFSSRQLEDASFLRLRNITLSYQLNGNALGLDFFKSARVYVTGQNLFTLTSYTGYDPEVNTFADQDNLSLGIDYGTYPRARTYLMGINLTF